MPTFTASTDIDRPAAEVWTVLADYERDPEWRAGVETMSPSTLGPAVVGTTTAEVVRAGGRTYRNPGVVHEVEPGARLGWRTTEGADADAEGTRVVRATGPSTCEVTLELSVRYRGSQRLLAPLLTPMLRKGLRADLAALASLMTVSVGTSPP